MFILFLMFLFNGTVKSEPFPNIPSITVEGTKDLELYVAPINVINESTKPRIEAIIGNYSVFGYASMHSHNAEISNGFNGFEPIELRYGKFNIYDISTIQYIIPDCDYEKNHRECTYKEDQFLLETNITVDDNQLVIQLLLFDSDMQVIASAVRTVEKYVRFIKQQEIKKQAVIFPGSNQSQSDCSGTTCSKPRSQPPSSVVGLHKPKEEKPLRWEVPHRLLDKHVSQASILLWCSVRISEN